MLLRSLKTTHTAAEYQCMSLIQPYLVGPRKSLLLHRSAKANLSTKVPGMRITNFQLESCDDQDQVWASQPIKTGYAPILMKMLAVQAELFCQRLHRKLIRWCLPQDSNGQANGSYWMYSCALQAILSCWEQQTGREQKELAILSRLLCWILLIDQCKLCRAYEITAWTATLVQT